MTNALRSTLILVTILAIGESVMGAGVRVIEFTSPACLPCRRMQPVVAKLQREGYPIQVKDWDRDRIIAKWYGVTQVPAFVVLYGDKLAMIVQGEMTEKDLRGLFGVKACEPASTDPGDVSPSLPLPNKEGWRPAPDLPPTPKPEPPLSGHGPLKPDNKPMVPVDGPANHDGVNLYVYGYGPNADSPPAGSSSDGDGATATTPGTTASPASNTLTTVGNVAEKALVFSTPFLVSMTGGSALAGVLAAWALRAVFAAIRSRRQHVEYEYSDQPAGIVQETVIEAPAKPVSHNITYKNPPVDDGLGRMRRAMRDVSETYPQARQWVQMFEKAYSLLLSGDVKNG